MEQPSVKESIQVLRECEALQIKKSNDYQNPHSRIKQADYYPRGVATILDIIQAKVLRMYSVIEAMENDPNYVPNFESFEDSCKDLCNYSSFAVAYSRGKVDGQIPGKDFLNRTIPPIPPIADGIIGVSDGLIATEYVDKIMGYQKETP
jgi:hypothetical protein